MSISLRLSLALREIDLPTGSICAVNAQADGYGDLEGTTCLQNFKPICDKLERLGFAITTEAPNNLSTAIVEITRSKPETLGLIATAYKKLVQGGLLIVNGTKTDGIESHLKSLRKLLNVDGVISKAHGKVFWLSKTDTPDIFETWAQNATPAINPDGFWTQAGIFSANHIDAGSAQLEIDLPKNLAGKGVDLGAGWGYLANRALNKYEKIKSLDLVEADRNALECAKRNVNDPRASFYWDDATTFTGAQYDFAIMNPPFHNSRKAEPDIGRAFIQNAARLLGPKGQLWMVANRQLAYEGTLNSCFTNSQIVTETPQFKVIRADRPKK